MNPLGPSMNTLSGSSSKTATFAEGAGVEPRPVLRNSHLPARSGDLQPSAYRHAPPSTRTSRNALPFGSFAYSVNGDPRPAEGDTAGAVARADCPVPMSPAI